jgi:hypothetical protein
MGSALPDELQFSTFMLKKTHGECPDFLGADRANVPPPKKRKWSESS